MKLLIVATLVVFLYFLFMFGLAKKTKLAIVQYAGIGTAIVTMAVTSDVHAFLIQSGAVTLENGDVSVVTNAGTAGLTTMFEGLKLLGVVVLVSGGAWLVSKAFNAVAGMFSSGNK